MTDVSTHISHLSGRLFLALVLIAAIPKTTDAHQPTALKVHVADAQQLIVPGATCSLASDGGPTTVAITDAQGDCVLDGISSAAYTLRVELPGFTPFVRMHLVLDVATVRDGITVVLSPAGMSERVAVAARQAGDTSVSAGSVPPQGVIDRRVIQRLPLAIASVREALPLVPSVLRSATGELTLHAGGETQNGLRVNGMNAVDPATGTFRLSLPVDAVEAFQVFLHPYTAEYGQFTAGVTQVDTRKGSDRWRFELNDFLPDLRFVGGKLRGIAEDAPHLYFGGPLFGKRVTLSQSASYAIAKRPVRGLEFPVNETRTESQSYFTQLDVVARPGHSQTVTIGDAPQRQEFIGLDVFRPQSATPSAVQRDLVFTARDNSVLHRGLLTTSISVSRFNTAVWARGTQDLRITPTAEGGNYFATQDRASTRQEFLEVYALPTRRWLGTHDIKTGIDINRVSSHLGYRARPVDVVRGDGTLAERVEFDPASAIDAMNREFVGFVQDRWAPWTRLALDLGLRYEDQRIADAAIIAPRVGFAWSPSAAGHTVIRGGIGLFFDKVPLNIRSFAQYPARTVTRFASDGVTIVERRRFVNVLADAATDVRPASGEADDRAEFVPGNVTWNLQVDRTVSPWLGVRANVIDSQTDNLYVANPRITGTASGVIELSSTGRSSYKAEEVAARLGRATRALTVSYTHSRARGDLNEFASVFGDFASPLLRPNQYSQLPTDAPHRLLAWGTIALPRRISVGPIFEVRSGFPYAVRDAMQDFVGTRNADTTRFPRLIALDLEVAREFQVSRRYAVRLSVRGFNLTNHFNPRDVHANVDDPAFGRFLASYRRYFVGGFDVIF